MCHAATWFHASMIGGISFRPRHSKTHWFSVIPLEFRRNSRFARDFAKPTSRRRPYRPYRRVTTDKVRVHAGPVVRVRMRAIKKLALDVAKRLSPKRTLDASVLAGVPYLAEHARQTCAPRPKCTKCPLVSFCATGISTLVKLPRTQPIVVDLFGGAGGLGFGFRQAKYRIGLAVELDRNAASPISPSLGY